MVTPGIAVDSAGNVYVADGTNDRIQKFDTNGRLLAEWVSTDSGNGGSGSPGLGSFHAPSSIAAKPEALVGACLLLGLNGRKPRRRRRPSHRVPSGGPRGSRSSEGFLDQVATPSHGARVTQTRAVFSSGVSRPRAKRIGHFSEADS